AFRSSMLYVVASAQGRVCYSSSVTMAGVFVKFPVSTHTLPEGVIRFTLFDPEGVPHCERMVFVKKDLPVAAHVQCDREHFSPRDSVTLSVSVSGNNKHPAQTSLSVSVVDGAYAGREELSENIRTRLLLQSDLKGYVEDPSWYFGPST